MRQRITSGYLIIYVMILTFITMSVGLSVLSVAGSQYTYTKDDVYRQNAVNGANACAYAVADELTADPGLTGTVYNNQTVFTNLNDSNGYVACHASVTNGPDSTKQATITSKMYRFSGDPHPISYQMEATLGSQGGSATNLDYLKGGVLIGNGGINMPATTDTSGAMSTPQLNVIGQLRVAGYGLASVGSPSNPIDSITVANIGCGDSTNWPQPCTTQPVTAYLSSSIDSIYGNTCAPGQTVGTTSFKNPGLQTSCSLPTQAMPGFDKQSFVDGMTSTIQASDVLGTGSNGCLSKTPKIPGYPAFGYYYYGTTKHIPANTRIEGSLSKYFDGTTDITTSDDLKSACTLVFDGNAYITGKIDPILYIRLSNTMSADSTIVVNGKIKVSKQINLLPSSGGHLAHIISFYSSSPTCSTNDDIPSATVRSCLTPAQAKQSAQIDSSGVAIDPAIEFTSINDTFDMSGITFYAYYGSISTGCNTLKMAAIAAQAMGGGCYSMALLSHIDITRDTPTFGDLIPATVPEYKVIDIRRL